MAVELKLKAVRADPPPVAAAEIANAAGARLLPVLAVDWVVASKTKQSSKPSRLLPEVPQDGNTPRRIGVGDRSDDVHFARPDEPR